MTRIDPSNHRVLLVGPRVVHLKPFFEKRGYPVIVAGKGVDGMALLDATPCDLVLLELNLGDLTATEFLMAARQGHPRSSFLLLDEANRAGQIVKALQAGLDGYLATPPEEDRLFYEVERHLNRVAAVDGSGFDESSTQTTMTTVAEVASIQVALADRESQLIEQQQELDRAHQAVRSLREDARRHEEDARRLQDVQRVLAGHLENTLDADEAMRLRERLALAQVADIELQSLRAESEALRSSRRDLEQRLDDTQRELKLARAAADVSIDISMEEDRVEGLQADVEHLTVRNKELQASLNDVRAALATALEEAQEANASFAIADGTIRERELDVQTARGDVQRLQDELAAQRRLVGESEERVSLLDAEIARLNMLLTKAETAAARANDDGDARLQTAQATIVTLTADVKRLTDEVAAGQERLARAQAKGAEDEITRAAEMEDAIATAVDLAVERERTRLQAQHLAMREEAIAAAVQAERQRLVEKHEKALAASATDVETLVTAAQKEADAQIEALQLRTRDAEERALDIEFQLEEARTRVEFLESDVDRVQREATARIADAEAGFKREKLRLVEEKQAAASGSQEAVLKMERFTADNTALKRSLAELQEQYDAQLTAVAESGSALAAALDDSERERERAAVAIEAMHRTEAAMGALQAHARDLEASVVAAQASSDGASARAAQLAAEVQALSEAVTERERAQSSAAQTIAELREAFRASEERLAAAEDRAAAVEGDSASTLRQQAATIAALERDLEQRQHRYDDALNQLRGERAQQEAALEAARLAAEQHATALAKLEHDLTAARAAASTASVETDAAVATIRQDAAQRLQGLQAQLAQTEARLLEAQAQLERAIDRSEFETLRAERDGQLVRISTLESELTNAKASGGAPSASDAALATVRSLLQAVDPLRWGLGAAIDYLSAFEGNDQGLASHVRNMRLLQATLARLATESGKVAAAG
jgi:DNA-binding response OmpR family regulator